MEEGEHKLCLVEPLLELKEKMLLQIQMQLLEEMQVLEALGAEEDAEGTEDTVIMVKALPRDQEQMEALVEREVMEVAAEEEGEEEMALLTRQGQEV